MVLKSQYNIISKSRVVTLSIIDKIVGGKPTRGIHTLYISVPTTVIDRTEKVEP